MSNKEWKKRSKRKLKIKKDFGLRCLVDKLGMIIKVRSKTQAIFDRTLLLARRDYSASSFAHSNERLTAFFQPL